MHIKVLKIEHKNDALLHEMKNGTNYNLNSSRNKYRF